MDTELLLLLGGRLSGSSTDNPTRSSRRFTGRPATVCRLSHGKDSHSTDDRRSSPVDRRCLSTRQHSYGNTSVAIGVGDGGRASVRQAVVLLVRWRWRGTADEHWRTMNIRRAHHTVA